MKNEQSVIKQENEDSSMVDVSGTESGNSTKMETEGTVLEKRLCYRAKLMWVHPGVGNGAQREDGLRQTFLQEGEESESVTGALDSLLLVGAVALGRK